MWLSIYIDEIIYKSRLTVFNKRRDRRKHFTKNYESEHWTQWHNRNIFPYTEQVNIEGETLQYFQATSMDKADNVFGNTSRRSRPVHERDWNAAAYFIKAAKDNIMNDIYAI